VLAAFALAVPFDALGHLLARSLYATHNTLLPLGAAVAGFAVTIVVTLALVNPVGIVAIPLGFAAGLAVRTAVQAVALAYRLRSQPPAAAADPLPA
ncbi:MAG TPA: lipid II flippase MurJ, partial [Candidatus Limnocylindrales bacterium]